MQIGSVAGRALCTYSLIDTQAGLTKYQLSLDALYLSASGSSESLDSVGDGQILLHDQWPRKASGLEECDGQRSALLTVDWGRLFRNTMRAVEITSELVARGNPAVYTDEAGALLSWEDPVNWRNRSLYISFSFAPRKTIKATVPTTIVDSTTSLNTRGMEYR